MSNILPLESHIRPATIDDAEELLNIYAPYVKNTAITFEYKVPSLTEFKHRIECTLQRYPYIVITDGDKIDGYAYTSAFSNRDAYDWAVETTIYLNQNKRKSGLGKRLYEALEKISQAQNIINLNACIGVPEEDDEYLTGNSASFHKHLGYRLVGRFHKCGYKFNRWYDMVWMEKCIGAHPEYPQQIIPFRQLIDYKCIIL